MIRRLVGALIAVCPCVLTAQDVRPVTVEVAAGSGPHTERSGDTWFRDTHNGILRVGGAFRLPTVSNRFAAVARVDYNVPGMGDRLADCPPAPNGTCRKYFPETDGFSLGAGVLTSVMPRALLGVSFGFFRSAANRYVALSASYEVAKHLAALVEWRYIDLEYSDDGRVSYRPIQVGVRVY